MTEMSKRVGQRVQRARLRRAWTQERLAAKAGISREYLARVETGRHEPSLSKLASLAKALRVKVRDLV